MKHIQVIPFILLILANSLQAKEKADSVDLSTPYHSVVNHLDYLEDENFHPELAALSLDTDGIPSEEAKSLAIKLQHYFNAKGLYIEREELPKDANYIDPDTKKERFYPVPGDVDIYLRKTEKGWRYSSKTVSVIPEKHREVFPLGTELLVEILPKQGHRKIMGLYLWQHLGIMGMILFAFLFYKIFPPLIRKFLFKILRKTADNSIDLNRYGPVAKMVALFVISIVFSILFPVLQLPMSISKNGILILKGLVPFFGMLIVYKMVDLLGIYLQKVAERTENTLDDQLVPLVRKALKVFVVVIGILFILQNLNFNVTALLAGVSIGGLAFALAAQDTIKNLFGSLMIFLDKPFQAGDWISSGDVDGTVEEVGFRSTRVRTFRNSVVYVPNSKLADSTIDNHGLRKFRRFKTTVAITYDTPPALIDVFVEGMKSITQNHPHTNKDIIRIFLNDFGDSSLNILLDIYFIVPDYIAELRCRQEIMLQIIELAEKLNVRFAFPTQTLHMETFPGKPSLTPVYDLKGKILKKDQGRQKDGTIEIKDIG
ncbi:MAG: mechanosensitive ion channel family protein [Cytophagaceae bacterium]